MTSDLDQIMEKLEKLENKSRNIDTVYGHRFVNEDSPLRLTGVTCPPGSVAAEHPDIVDAIKAYIKDMIKYQKQDMMDFSQMIMGALKNPSKQDELIERFGGNTTLQEIYSEGIFEIRAVTGQYKETLKSLKKL